MCEVLRPETGTSQCNLSVCYYYFAEAMKILCYPFSFHLYGTLYITFTGILLILTTTV